MNHKYETTMKNINKMFVLVGILVMMLGCKKNVQVSLSKSTLDINPAGDSLEVALTSNGEWQVSVSADWLSVLPMSGNGDATLKIVAAKNTNPEARSCTVEVSSSDNKATLEATQAAMADFIEVLPAQVNCEYTGGQFDLQVASNVDWLVSDVPEWITCAPETGSGSGTLHLSVSEWSSETRPREASLTIGAGETKALVTVVQSAKPSQLIVVSPERIELGYAGETASLSVTCNGGWYVENEDQAEWIMLSSTVGNGPGEIEVTVPENTAYFERVCSLRFVSEFDTEAFVKVIQLRAPNPHFLNVNPSEVEIAGGGGNVAVAVECDTTWHAESADEWINIEAPEGHGNGTLALSVEANAFVMGRQGRVRLTSGELVIHVTVNQQGSGEAASVTLLPETMVAPKEGAVRTIEIEANVSWRLESSPWIDLLTTSGVGNGTCGVAIDANSTYASRTGYVKAFYGNMVMDEVEVVQEGNVAILEADITVINATAETNKYMVIITANQPWRVENTIPWLRIDANQETGQLVVGVAANTTSAPRTGEFKVVGVHSGEVVITVNQQ